MRGGFACYDVLLEQQIVIPLGVFAAFFGAVIIFLLTHLFGAIWFASRVNTKVGMMAQTLESLEQDVKLLVKFDAKIEVLHERMNSSQQDRTKLWEALVDIRRAVSSIQLRENTRDDEHLKTRN